MSIALRIETVVQPDGKIELNVPQLTPGQRVTVIVEAAEIVEAKAQTPQKRRAADILAEAPGHLQFQTAKDVDEYIREERDAWER